MRTRTNEANCTWTNCELSRADSNEFKRFLRTFGIKFEASGIDAEWTHFEVFCDTIMRDFCNDFLATL